MLYPSRSDYLNAIRYPQFAFGKKNQLSQFQTDLAASLVTGKALEKANLMGMKTLWSASGSCAIVFKYETISPPKLWAIRCFYRSSFEIIKHYQKALKHLSSSSCRKYFVDCFLLEEGIQVLGKYYPLLTMEWVEGQNLKKFLKANLGNKVLLQKLAQGFCQLSQDLLEAGMAHGDLQHGNLLITNQSNPFSLKLIDYDSLYFVQEACQFNDTIKGLSDYQHPLRKFVKKRDITIDFFSQLVIYLSILALAENPRLWNIYELDEREGLLFSCNDFQNPQSAEILESLSHLSSPMPTLANKLKNICQLQSFEKIPSLSEFLSNESIILRQENSILKKINLLPIYQITSPFKLTNKAEKKIQFLQDQWQSHIQLSYTLFEKFYHQSIPNLQTVSGKLRHESSENIQFLKDQWQSHIQRFYTLFEKLYYQSIPNLQTVSVKLRHESSEKIQFLKDQWQSQIQLSYTLFEKLYYRKKQYFQSFSVKLTDGAQQQIQSLRNFLGTLSISPHAAANSQEHQQILSIKSQFKHEIQEQIKALKKQLNFPFPIWKTEIIAKKLDCSVDWCYQQFINSPHQFREGEEYFKNNKRQIYWTKSGLSKLRKLYVKTQKSSLSSSYLSTQDVSLYLEVSQTWILKTRVNYAAHLQEGMHYKVNIIDSRKQYYWTAEGVAYLQQLHRLIYPSKYLKK